MRTSTFCTATLHTLSFQSICVGVRNCAHGQKFSFYFQLFDWNAVLIQTMCCPTPSTTRNSKGPQHSPNGFIFLESDKFLCFSEPPKQNGQRLAAGSPPQSVGLPASWDPYHSLLTMSAILIGCSCVWVCMQLKPEPPSPPSTPDTPAQGLATPFQTCGWRTVF